MLAQNKVSDIQSLCTMGSTYRANTAVVPYQAFDEAVALAHDRPVDSDLMLTGIGIVASRVEDEGDIRVARGVVVPTNTVIR